MSTAGEATAGTVRRGAHTIRWVMIGLAVLVLLPALAMLGSRVGKDATLTPSVLIGKPAPSFSLATLDGKTISNADLRGKPYVVNFWASWCGPCREEFPYFQEAAAKLGGRVAFLGVDSQDASDAAKQFLSEFPVPYPSYQDPDEKIVESFDARFGLPATAFYDSQGELVYTKQGPYVSQADLEADIKRYAR
jgi:thiol-disulfide isomerase/thioredoxin